MISAPTSTHDTCVGAILFTDLVGFTEFTDVVGDSAALALLEEQTELVGELIGSRPDARVVKELGDGLMLWFASAAESLDCSVALLSSIDAARAEGTFPLAVRMGLHHGEAAVRGDDLIGKTVNIAARVADLAGPGELLVSEAAIDAAGAQASELDLRTVGPASVKGVQEPVWLYLLGS